MLVLKQLCLANKAMMQTTTQTMAKYPHEKTVARFTSKAVSGQPRPKRFHLPESYELHVNHSVYLHEI